MLDFSLLFSTVLRKLLLAPIAVALAIAAAGANDAAPSNSDERIRQAEKKAQASPESYQSFNDLTAALCRKARDTEDPALYDRAMRALQNSFRLSPANYDGRKLEAGVLIGRRDYARALSLAKELNHKVPDDIAVWALLVDANVGLGSYSEAERCAQWVLDLRPGNPLGFEKAAVLRELFGDIPGSVEFIDEANRRILPNDTSERAWLFLQKARLQSDAGYQAEAEHTLNQALLLDSNSLLALKIEAKIRLAQGKPEEAARLLEICYARVQSGTNLYAWAEALEKSGRKAEAVTAFARFASQAQADIAKPDNPTGQLVLYKVDRGHDRPGALALASKLAEVRHDCATLDALAWALYGNGKYPEAKIQIERALAVGVREPLYLCHAAQISAMVNDSTAAEKYRKELASFSQSACPTELPARTATEAGK